MGDSALLVDLDSSEEAHGLAAALDGGTTHEMGVAEVIVGHRSVTVVVEPRSTDIDALSDTLATMPLAPAHRSTGRRLEIPVVLDGPDLGDVAQRAGLSPARVVDLLTGTDLEVAFVGFAPGFAYLVGLPPELASIPRRPTPRPAVPGGSVALAGGFAAIYPQTSPGGWQIVGHSGIELFDPTTPPYALLRAGDRVRLTDRGRPTAPIPITGASPTTGRPPWRSDARRTLLVENPGLLSLVQDLGRPGVAALGVPPAGAVDPYALRIANRMVGNAEGSAAIETTARGPTLRFAVPAHVAVVGSAPVRIDGHPVPEGSVLPVGAGQTLATGDERRGLRSYIAVSGGIDVPAVLGSRSSDVLCRLGPGPLVAGDVVALGTPGRPGGRFAVGPPSPGAEPTIRVMVGPDRFPAATVDGFVSTTWTVDRSSDRIGVRLQADPPWVVPPLDVTSRGMVTGAIQLPPDSRPIVLLNDHATVGGYPVIATVVSADLGLVGQLRPGDPVRFEPVDRQQASRARAERERTVNKAVIGWYPVRSD
jgi:KipI family sensor histidine kinase inhibitor